MLQQGAVSSVPFRTRSNMGRPRLATAIVDLPTDSPSRCLVSLRMWFEVAHSISVGHKVPVALSVRRYEAQANYVCGSGPAIDFQAD